jgi:hypothetical protein
MDHTKVLPQWAPRVPQAFIRRFYAADAQGIYDDVLIDEVGYALLSRCQSFLDANAAVQGRAPCPACNRVVFHRRDKAALLQCICGWTLPWADYFATIQHKQLSGAEPVLQLFQDFVTRFPSARSAQEKVILIDQLLHGFHWYQQHSFTRPVAVNLIGGKLADVIALLDSLTYGDASTPGTRTTYTEWVEKSQNVRRWALKEPPTAE